MSATLAQKPDSQSAAHLPARFAEVRGLSLKLTAPLSAEDQMLQSMPDASPTKWHLAHTTWFFETFILQPTLKGYRAFDSRFTYLFNSYYKQLGAHPFRGSRGLMSRPTLEQVLAYRAHVDAAMPSALESATPEILDLAELGLNHEQQHQELILTDIKHGLWSGPLRPDAASQDPAGNRSAIPLEWLRVEGGIHSIGYAGDGFSFDNESPRHEVLLRDFAIGSHLVTNAEYLEFMHDGGYRRPELWLSDGWDTVNAQRWDAPLYWEHQDDDSWQQFTRQGMKSVDLAEPVCHVSYYEADAFARWSGARLPLEEEWEIAATLNPARGTLLEDGEVHPRAATSAGAQQFFGDVWEWTASPYVAYPGFQPAPGLVGEYNGKFMCNQFVLRGGSCATPASHIRASYRNFFPPHARWQFSGIRLAK